jgi:hypothetical protein
LTLTDDWSTRPTGCPIPNKWWNNDGTGKPGKIYIGRHPSSGDDVWVYEDSTGITVAYPDGHPNFREAGLVIETVRFKNDAGEVTRYAGNYDTDFSYADHHSTTVRVPGVTVWDHHVNMTDLDLIPKAIHDRFRHWGGVSERKRT